MSVNAPDISPTTHPNAYATISSGSVALFIVHEAKSRAGIDLTLEEAGYIVLGVTTSVLFLGKRFGPGRSK